MDKHWRVVCGENQQLVEFMWKKRQEMAERPRGISENIERTLQKACANVCSSKTPIKTLKDFSQIKGVGKWILRLMQEFFGTESGSSEQEESTNKGKKSKGTKRYVPQKNSVPYALLITLYRGTATGSDFMRKPELIDAAEASGLSRVPIRPELGKGKPGQFGSSPREWYSGWSSMKTLVTKGLVAKSSNPAKYMLTEEGREAAQECLSRSGLVDATESLIATERLPIVDLSTISDLECVRPDVTGGVTMGSVSSSSQNKSVVTKGVMFGSVGSSLQKKSLDVPIVDLSTISDLECVRADVTGGVMMGSVSSSSQNKSVVTKGSVGSSLQKKSLDVPPESLDRFLRMGYTKEQTLSAFAEVSETSQNKEIASLWPEVLCHLREEQVYNLPLESQKSQNEDFLALSYTSKSRDGHLDLVMTENTRMELGCSGALRITKSSCLTADSSFTLEACSSNAQMELNCRGALRIAKSSCLSADSSLEPCSSTGYPVYKRGLDGSEPNMNFYEGGLDGSEPNMNAYKGGLDGAEPNMNIFTMPPLRFGERFEEAYEVILVLDDREHFASHGSRAGKIIENIRSQFKIRIEVRRLPVGDGIWIARDKQLRVEYVLDFIVERKNVVDLHCSIRDNRYRDQKLRLMRCGLKKLIYMVEGDPNSSEAAESIKTACFTTEILEGFDVQRTSGLGDTLRRYGYLTQAITQHCKLLSAKGQRNSLGVCPTFGDFIRRSQNLDKMTVSDVFAIQLMQVPQVTEELAIAVLDLYPTLISLARAYSLLEGDLCAQEEMLKKQSNNIISGAASKNIFKLVWGS
ncbi:crossover junction endonuclease MUS81 isoform X2 [Rhododendron vialii]|uniref:crossover junction endonuclease MUS81 isoform X2 n=1 Tax=Rhododendron vialii TaxID=182163 RepID=UPI00265FE814|nr:crossover junction endonuclease MUS81 isoform X2 [Rhododendron vialii]